MLTLFCFRVKSTMSKREAPEYVVEWQKANNVDNRYTVSFIYGDGIRRVLALANAVAEAADGILLIDEIEAAIHKKAFDDVLRFILKACRTFNDQVFITTQSIEVIDALLFTQDYDKQDSSDDICVCTIKRGSDVSYSRVLSGREVYESRESFGFEVRL